MHQSADRTNNPGGSIGLLRFLSDDRLARDNSVELQFIKLALDMLASRAIGLATFHTRSDLSCGAAYIPLLEADPPEPVPVPLEPADPALPVADDGEVLELLLGAVVCDEAGAGVLAGTLTVVELVDEDGVGEAGCVAGD